jgi:hypothetical protein
MHEEDTLEMCAKDALYEENKYLVFYEIDKELEKVDQDELFFGVEMYCKQKRSPFSSITEDVNFSFPKCLLIN